MTDTTSRELGLIPEPRPRLRSCVEAWPECEDGEYNPACCRFPKSCSCTVYDDAYVSPEDLEETEVAPRNMEAIRAINTQNEPQTALEDEFNKYLSAPPGDASSEPPRLYTREDMARAHTQGYLSARRGESREANPYT